MGHPLNVVKYSGSNEELAKDLTNLRYDKLAEIFEMIAGNLRENAEADRDRGRDKLAAYLSRASVYVRAVGLHIEEAWKISKPYMENLKE